MTPDPIPAACHLCQWEQAYSSQQEADRRLAVHLQHAHRMPPLAGVTQLDSVSWQEAFLAAVRRVPVGSQLTTADLHGLVPSPPSPNCWGSATSRAAHLGLLREVGRQESVLASTKRSLVRRWERVDETRRGAAV